MSIELNVGSMLVRDGDQMKPIDVIVTDVEQSAEIVKQRVIEAGEQVIDSIPDDYSEMSQTVKEMSEEYIKINEEPTDNTKILFTTSDETVDYATPEDIQDKMERYVIRLTKNADNTYKMTSIDDTDLSFSEVYTATRDLSKYVVLVYGNSKLRPQYVSENEMMFVGLDRSTETKVLRILYTPTRLTYETFKLAEYSDLDYMREAVNDDLVELDSRLSESIAEISDDMKYVIGKKISTNNANPVEFTIDKRMATSGALTGAVGYCASGFIEIHDILTIFIDNQYYQFNKPVAIRFYDSNKICDTSFNRNTIADAQPHQIDIPENMKYIRISWEYMDGVEENRVYVGNLSESEFVYSEYGESSVSVLPSDEVKEARGEFDTLGERIDSLVPKSEVKKLIYWGDSLTEGNQAGDGGTRPKSMQALLGEEWEVFNFGRGGDRSNSIACRQGGMNLVVKPNQAIPSSGAVILDIEDNFGDDVGVRIYNVGGNGRSLNPCYINGIKGTLMRGASNYPLNKAEFTREESGNPVTLSRPTPVLSNGASEYRGYPCIIYIGQNQGFDITKPETLLNQVKNMVRWANTDKYLVLGLCHQTGYTWQIACNDLLREEFGRRFLDIEKYLKTPIYNGETIVSSYAMNDEGLTPTADDLTKIANNQYPTSIMYDGIHFNKYGYECIAKLEYQRGKELGYW